MNGTAIFLALAAVSFILTVIWGGPLIRILKMLKLGDTIRLELRDIHAEKSGTPTMGGVMFVIPIVVITGVMNAVSLIGLSPIGFSVLLPIGTMLSYAGLGAVDDWQKLRNKAQGEGISARVKFIAQIVITIVIAAVLYFVLDVPHMFVPTIPWEIVLPWWVYLPLATFVIVSAANAINFTDGLDGMAGLIAATCFAAFGIIAGLQEQVFIAQFCFITVGALFGFLWFNVFPAQLFMGDTGSMALGGGLGVVALMTGQWLLLPIIAIVPVAQVVSVMIQVVYFKISGGKRIFKRAPIHHHFEMLGWSETQVMQRFWLITLLTSLIGVALAMF